MNKKRPININPLSIKLPIPALVSISHRISGIVVFLFIPFLLYILSLSLKSEENYADMIAWLQSPLIKFVLWAVGVGLFFHLVAGLRHLLMDLHLGETLRAGRLSAIIVFVLSALFAIWAAFALGGWS